MNSAYEKILEIPSAGLRNIYRFSNWRVARLTRAIKEGNANPLEDDDYINRLEDHRDFWLSINKSLEARLQHAH